MIGSLLSIGFDGLAYAMLLFIVSVGLSVTMGLMGFVNLAHGAFAMAGGYVVVVACNRFDLTFPGALLVAAFTVGAVSLAFERLLYRRLYGASELDQVLLSIGLVMMTAAALSWAFGPSPQHVGMPGWLTGAVGFGRENYPTYRVVTICVGFAMMVLLALLFEFTEAGARIRAAVDNRRMARSVGINVDLLFAGAFAVGSALAALGGGLAIELIGLGPTFAAQYLVFFLIVVAVGGLGSIRGTFLAALVIGLFDTAAKYWWPAGGTVFVYILTVGLLVLRPAGLCGRR